MNTSSGSTSSGNDHITSFLTIISIVGTIGNLIVAFVYWQKKDKQTSTFFILVLAFIDLTVCFILVPMTIYMEKIMFETDNILVCKTYYFLTTTTVPSSSLLMTAIAFDRFFCICMVNRNIMTYSRAKIIGIMLLIFSSLLGIIPALASVTQFKGETAQNLTDEFYSVSNSSSLNQQCLVDMDGKFTIFGILIMPFKFFYDFIFIVLVITITFLYILIYKEIYTRRKMKRDNKRKLMYNSLMNGRGNLVKEKENNDEENNSKTLIEKMFFCFENFNLKNNNREEKSKKGNLLQNKLLNEQTHVSIPLIKITKVNDNCYENEQEPEKNLEKSEDISNKEINSNRRVSLEEDGENNNQPNQNKILVRKQSSIRRKSISYGKHSLSTKDIRTAFMLFVVSFLFIVFYLPSITATYLTLFIPNLSSNLYISYLYFSNSAINPIIYCFLNPNFRTDLLKLFFKRGFLFDKCAKHTNYK